MKKILTWKWTKESRDGIGVGGGSSYRFYRFTRKLVDEMEIKKIKINCNRLRAMQKIGWCFKSIFMASLQNIIVRLNK